MRTNLTADTHGRSFQQKTVSLWKNEVFGLFSGDKGDDIDMWMIKITIKENQIDMDVLLIPEVDNVQRPCLSLKSGFFHQFIGLRIFIQMVSLLNDLIRARADRSLYIFGTMFVGEGKIRKPIN